MSTKIHEPRPVTPSEAKLLEKFHEHLAGQSDLMDNLSKQLIALELAIPSLYAAVLKYKTIPPGKMLYAAFGCWLLSLLLTLIGLYPRKWEVNPHIMRQDPKAKTGVLGIEDYFEKTAQYKRRFVFAASVLFFAGVCCAAFLIL